MLTVRLPRLPRALSRARSLATSASRMSFFASTRKTSPASRQPHVPLVAIEEQCVELLLELLDAPADMRLGDAQVLRRMTEVQMLGENDEGADALEVH